MKKTKQKKSLSLGSLTALFCVLTLTTALIAQYAVNCRNVRTGVLRLHVIANSDAQSDQDVKLTVRDAVLKCGADIFDGSVTSEQAVEKITPVLGRLEDTAVAVLTKNGMPYGAKAFLTEEYFDTRAYGDITLPAGKYTALKIVLGEGKGQNWWCVMYPPLCLPAAAVADDSCYGVFSDSGATVVGNENRYEIRFGIVEVFEKLLSFIDTYLSDSALSS